MKRFSDWSNSGRSRSSRLTESRSVSRSAGCTSSHSGWRTSCAGVRPSSSHSASFTSSQRPSTVLSPIPIGAPSNAVRKRSSEARSSALFCWSSSSIATFERSMSGSTGLSM